MLFMNNMWAILQQKRAEVILRKYSMEDGLTGLANRRRLEEVMEIEWRRARRNRTALPIIMADIDFFQNKPLLHNPPLPSGLPDPDPSVYLDAIMQFSGWA